MTTWFPDQQGSLPWFPVHAICKTNTLTMGINNGPLANPVISSPLASSKDQWEVQREEFSHGETTEGTSNSYMPEEVKIETPTCTWNYYWPTSNPQRTRWACWGRLAQTLNKMHIPITPPGATDYTSDIHEVNRTELTEGVKWRKRSFQQRGFQCDEPGGFVWIPSSSCQKLWQTEIYQGLDPNRMR